jgi:hypothetical protein
VPTQNPESRIGAVLTLFLVCNPISLKAPGNFFEVMQPLMLFIGFMWLSSGIGPLCSYIRRHEGKPSRDLRAGKTCNLYMALNALMNLVPGRARKTEP